MFELAVAFAAATLVVQLSGAIVYGLILQPLNVRDTELGCDRDVT